MAKGRPPKPTAILKLEGANSTRIKRRAEHEPEPEMFDEVPLPPAEMTDEAKEFWEALAPSLHACGILSVIDVPMLNAYCETYTRWRHAVDMIADEGAIIMVDGIPRVSPHVMIQDKYLARLIKLSTEYGMTPSSRARVEVDKSLARSDNPWEKFGAARAIQNRA